MHIDAVRAEDIDALMDIQTECGLSPWTRDGYADELNRPDAVMLAARSDKGEVAGFIVGRVSILAATGFASDGEILNIGTRRVFREQGIGSGLMDRFLEICANRGAKKVWLEVRAGNAVAIKFYTNYRFVVAATRPNFYSDPVEDALLMVRESED